MPATILNLNLKEMKAYWKYMWVLICTVGMCVGCSNDKDKNGADRYEGTYLGSNLELTINGVEMTGRVLGISNKGTLILQYIIPGETVVDIPLTATNDSFEGTAPITDGTVYVQGSVKNGKLTANLTITTSNALIGTWDLLPLT